MKTRLPGDAVPGSRVVSGVIKWLCKVVILVARREGGREGGSERLRERAIGSMYEGDSVWKPSKRGVSSIL